MQTANSLSLSSFRFRTMDRLHQLSVHVQDIHMIPAGRSKKRAHCQQVTFSFWPELAWEVPAAAIELWHQKLPAWVSGERRSWKRSSGGTLGPHIICQEQLHSNLNQRSLLGLRAHQQYVFSVVGIEIFCVIVLQHVVLDSVWQVAGWSVELPDSKKVVGLIKVSIMQFYLAATFHTTSFY